MEKKDVGQKVNGDDLPDVLLEVRHLVSFAPYFECNCSSDRLDNNDGDLTDCDPGIVRSKLFFRSNITNVFHGLPPDTP